MFCWMCSILHCSLVIVSQLLNFSNAWLLILTACSKYTVEVSLSHSFKDKMNSEGTRSIFHYSEFLYILLKNTLVVLKYLYSYFCYCLSHISFIIIVPQFLFFYSVSEYSIFCWILSSSHISNLCRSLFYFSIFSCVHIL